MNRHRAADLPIAAATGNLRHWINPAFACYRWYA
jgi:hypothetical protein